MCAHAMCSATGALVSRMLNLRGQRRHPSNTYEGDEEGTPSTGNSLYQQDMAAGPLHFRGGGSKPD